jgi:secreted PhoX family phosphatase
MLPANTAMVRVFARGGTPKNVGFPSTTGSLGSPDNLAQDPLGNIYIIEDAPNGSSTGGDVWFVRDVNDDGQGESLDHFLSIRVDGSEATGMEWSPKEPFEFVINVQHPDSADLDAVPGGFGDALWAFDVSGAPGRKIVREMRRAARDQRQASSEFRKKCRQAMRKQMRD